MSFGEWFDDNLIVIMMVVVVASVFFVVYDNQKQIGRYPEICTQECEKIHAEFFKISTTGGGLFQGSDSYCWCIQDGNPINIGVVGE